MAGRLLSTFLAFFLCTQFLLAQNDEIRRIDGSRIASVQIDELVADLMQKADVTGLGLSIFNNNEVVYQETFGFSNAKTKEPLRDNSIFYGASLSKAVFSVLVMQLVEEGVIDLDIPLQHYLEKPLPEYRFSKSWKGYHHLKNDKRYEAITARMCLTHTTGFPNWRFLSSTGHNSEGELYFQFDPGSRYSYSGEGLSLLQFVLEQITGKGLEEMAQKRIFKPLGMENSSYIYVWKPGQESRYVYAHDEKRNVLPKDEVDDAGAAGSMGTTLEDYSRFLAAVLQQKLLREHLYREMFMKQVDINSERQFGPKALVDTYENEDIDLGYGLGWGVLSSPYGRGAFKEGGSAGYQHYSIIFPEAETGVLIMTNSDNGDSIIRDLLEKTIADKFTPWEWENYIPYDYEEPGEVD